MTRIPAEDEAVTAPSSPLDNALAQLSAAVKTLGYDEGLHQMLAAPRREMAVSIPLRRDDGSTEVLRGYRVQHNFSRGPAKGGVRFSLDGSSPPRTRPRTSSSSTSRTPWPPRTRTRPARTPSPG